MYSHIGTYSVLIIDLMSSNHVSFKKGLKFVSLVTSERLHYSGADLSYFKLCSKNDSLALRDFLN